MLIHIGRHTRSPFRHPICGNGEGGARWAEGGRVRKEEAGARLVSSSGGGDEVACQGETVHEWNVAAAEAAEVRRRRTAPPATPAGTVCRGSGVKRPLDWRSPFGICAGRTGASEWENSTGRAGGRAPTHVHLPSLRTESRSRSRGVPASPRRRRVGVRGRGVPYRLGVRRRRATGWRWREERGTPT